LTELQECQQKYHYLQVLEDAQNKKLKTKKIDQTWTPTKTDG
jgi:hypothetical protein